MKEEIEFKILRTELLKRLDKQDLMLNKILKSLDKLEKKIKKY